jgi:cytochrome P450
MRITSPPSGSRVRLDEINLADTNLYTSGDAHLVWQTLRAESPVFWQAQPGAEGFWAVTRQADVRRVLADYQTFTSEKGTAIAMLGSPDPAAGLMMQATDPPRHGLFRQHLAEPFSAHTVVSYKKQIRSFVRDAISPARESEIWNAAEAFARLPMTVGAMMMGLPESDIDPLLKLAYASLAPRDPRYSSGSEKATAAAAHYNIIKYFTEYIDKRRASLSSDLISHLLTIQIEGRPLTSQEVLVNCLSLLLGAVVTTSHAITSTLIALAAQQNGEGHWPRMARLQVAVEEALRWSSPVTHFMRRARYDVEMHGEKIRAGDAITAWIASANRDETVFARPYELDLERTHNRHVAFGFGSHRCLGSHLARLMLHESFEELIASIECFELAGTPLHLVSNEIAGVVSLPLRLSFRAPEPGARVSNRLDEEVPAP